MKTKWIENEKTEPSYQEELFIEMEREIARIELEVSPNYVTEMEI